MSAKRMPALFLAHGNPMNALADNDFTRALARLAEDLPRPEAVLVVSAHWLTRDTRVLTAERPRTIHDFGGFPRELYEVQYPAQGPSAAYTDRVSALTGATPDDSWGLDHASWSVLKHMWPAADVPVFELSLDMTAPLQRHWELGELLAPLRDDGVLVVGSGNIVHSFAGVSWEPDARPHDWAIEFDEHVADALVRGDAHALVHYEQSGRAGMLSVPSTDHYLPLLYPAAMRAAEDTVTFPHVGIDMASMSMRCVRFG
ncbi:MAG: 4,5-DOPA-extradiol-dioxygenase [Coriobacteriia bacterium]